MKWALVYAHALCIYMCVSVDDLSPLLLQSLFPPVQLILHGAHVVIQSNAPDSERSNELFRINSGFYLVKSNALTQTAFEAIVADAQASALSEQPSFYKSLCGPNGEFRSGISEYNNMHNALLLIPWTIEAF